MREIKFRTWDRRGGENAMSPISWSPTELMEAAIRTQKILDDLFIFLQYTGLKDKNGKEICEGDIVRVTHQDKPYSRTLKTKDFNCEVYFNEADAAFHYRRPKNYGPFRVGMTIGKRCEIIGNIYETPNLLTNEE
jgi:uncharacterized phage protein (TIGR01671 family)